MPFSTANLTALVQGNGFTLWHYRTTDTRTAVTAAGYFAAATSLLRAGDLMVLQAADALALVPLRTGPAVGTGVTLDGAVGPFSAVRGIAHAFSFTQAASAVVRSVALAPLAAAVLAGASIPVSASVAGPISQLVFTLRNGNGATVPPAQVAPVSGGSASVVFPPPPVGTGYRVRVEDASDPAIGITSQSFNVGVDLLLLRQESGALLFLESGGALKQ